MNSHEKFIKTIKQIEQIDKKRCNTMKTLMNKFQSRHVDFFGPAFQASYWRKVWLRGLQMRRNVAQGRFEMWRLFMTDKDHLPVKKMTAETSHRELRSAHRNSRYNTKERHVRISRYWTEEYMIVIQYNEESAINDIFVWEWDEVRLLLTLYHVVHNNCLQKFKDILERGSLKSSVPCSIVDVTFYVFCTSIQIIL